MTKCCPKIMMTYRLPLSGSAAVLAALLLSGCKIGDNSIKGSVKVTSQSNPCSEGFNGGPCVVEPGYFSASEGSNVIGSDGEVSFSIPQGYYSGAQTCTAQDSDLTPGNIVNGVTIFGVTGSLSAGASSLAANAHRNLGTTQISQSDEVTTYAGVDLPAGYREVPDILLDDEGSVGGNVTFVDRTGWSTTTCGLSGTIDQRIADCAANGTIGTEATWDGAVKGNAGQGAWKLVTREGDLGSSLAGAGREVWRDERTGLLWSSKVATSLNWCKASGSNFITNNPSAQDDPNDYCDNATSQTTGTGPGNKAISACYEDGENYFTGTDGAIDDAGKGSLGSASTPAVRWRLPSIYEYEQANINGIRFVLPDSDGNYEWSASVVSSNRNSAWYFNGLNGIVYYLNRFNSRAVRCVGR